MLKEKRDKIKRNHVVTGWCIINHFVRITGDSYSYLSGLIEATHYIFKDKFIYFWHFFGWWWGPWTMIKVGGWWGSMHQYLSTKGHHTLNWATHHFEPHIKWVRRDIRLTHQMGTCIKLDRRFKLDPCIKWTHISIGKLIKLDLTSNWAHTSHWVINQINPCNKLIHTSN